ncbi:MAG: hypothetical protein H6R17_1989 [Proteobacteria bacterium]|nr:hypothetical protein [Pseudomonadota bacterium]
MIQGIAPSSTSAGLGFEMRTRFAAPSSTGIAALTSTGTNDSAESGASPAKSNELTAQEQQQVLQLRQTDRQVRAHEQAHLSVGGDLVRGGASFSYQTGPDQQRYAVAGEVSIDVSPASTPQETIPKAEHIRAAALAPADPSAQDNSVAAQAQRMASEARMEIAAMRLQQSATDQGGSRFYQGVEQSSGLGGRLDLFA